MIIAAFAALAALVAEPSDTFRPTGCDFVRGLVEQPAAVRNRYRCGRVAVPLDHARTDGRHIDLVVAVRLATSVTGRAPIVVLHGGGSTGAVRTALRYLEAPFPTDRDVVIVDYRGVGESSLGLCPDTTAEKVAALASDLNGEAMRTAYNAPLRACRASMDVAGVPPHVFGAVAVARDIERVRDALGYDRLVLIGNSQGTTVATTYAALYPERTEGMVLDSPYPPDPTPLSLSASFRAGLQGAADWCRGKPVCGPEGDRLASAFDEARAALVKAPMVLQPKGMPGFVLNADDFDLLTQFLLYPGVTRSVEPEVTAHALAPAFVAAVRRRDVATATKIGELALTRLANGPNSAVFASGECRDRPRYGTPLGEPFRGVEVIDFRTVCGWWTDAPVDPVRLPAATRIPALVVSGGADPITPTAFAQETARRLGPAAKLLLVPGWGHSIAASAPCAREAVAAFFADPSAFARPRSCAP